MAYDVKIIRTWVEPPRGRLKNGRRKQPVFNVLYFNELKHKQEKISTTIEKETSIFKHMALIKIIEQIQNKYKTAKSTDISIGELAEKYYEHMSSDKNDMRYQTRYQYTQHIKDFISMVDPAAFARNIKTAYFNNYFNNMLKDYSYSYVNTRRSILTHLYNYGIDYGYVKSNPLADYSLSKSKLHKSSNIEDKYLKPNELQALFKHLKKSGRNDYLDLFEFLYLTGLRLSEVAQLYPDNIKAEGDKSYVSIAGIQISKHNTKNKRIKNKKIDITQSIVVEKQNTNVQLIELSDEAAKIAKRHLNNESYLFAIGDNVTNKKALDFIPGHTIGNPFQTTTVNKFIKRAVANSGVQPFNKILTSNIFHHTNTARAASYSDDLNPDLASYTNVSHNEKKTIQRIYKHINSISVDKDKLKEDYLSVDNWIKSNID